MTKRKNYLDQDTAENAAYCIYMLAATHDPAERQRLAERLFRDLPIDNAARAMGHDMQTHIMQRRARTTSRRPIFTVEDIVTTDEAGRVAVDHDKLDAAHSDTVRQVLATLRSRVAAQLAQAAVQS